MILLPTENKMSDEKYKLNVRLQFLDELHKNWDDLDISLVLELSPKDYGFCQTKMKELIWKKITELNLGAYLYYIRNIFLSWEHTNPLFFEMVPGHNGYKKREFLSHWTKD